MIAAMLAHADGAVFGAFSWWTFALRFGLLLANVAPTLMVGVLLAGFLHTRTGRAWLRAVLDGPPARSIGRAMVLGCVTPVGALGALPVATAMLHCGIRPGVVVVFVATAPLLLPWSLGFAADQMGWVVTGAILLSGVIGALAAAGCGAAARRADAAAEAPAGPELLAALRAAARYASGALWLYVVLALGASAALAAVLEPGAIEAHLGETSAATLLELSVPLALAPIDADTAGALAGEFWRIGLLTGGVVACFLLGAGWNLGTAWWYVRRLGAAGLAANVAWLAVATTLALACNAVLRPDRPGEADSHAFDTLTQPYNFGDADAGVEVAERWRRALHANGGVLAVLALLAAVGITDRVTAARRAHAGRPAANAMSSTPPSQRQVPGGCLCQRWRCAASRAFTATFRRPRSWTSGFGFTAATCTEQPGCSVARSTAPRSARKRVETRSTRSTGSRSRSRGGPSRR